MPLTMDKILTKILRFWINPLKYQQINSTFLLITTEPTIILTYNIHKRLKIKDK